MDNQVNQTFDTVTQTAENKCSNCGAALNPGQAFCAVCGTPAPAPAPKANVCSNCGNEIQEGVAFCPNCGNNVSVAAPTPTAPSIDAYNQQVAKKKSNMPKIIIGAVAAVLAIVLAIVLIPILQVTPEELIAEGKYAEAYEKAETSDKNKILAENVIAVLSQEASEGLKNPSSFVLRDGYYKAWNNSEKGTFGQQAVLYLSGTNSYGAAVSSYWVFVYDNDAGEWEYWGSCTTTASESSDELSDTLVKIVAESVMEDGIKLDKTQVKNINTRFEEDTLYTINLIPKYDIDKSLFPTE